MTDQLEAGLARLRRAVQKRALGLNGIGVISDVPLTDADEPKIQLVPGPVDPIPQSSLRSWAIRLLRRMWSRS